MEWMDMDQLWQKLLTEFSARPRDVQTRPMNGQQPKWFYTQAVPGALYVERGHSGKNPSQISVPRQLHRRELETMLDLYRRRKQGKPVSQEAGRATQNQVYWYGVFAEMGL